MEVFFHVSWRRSHGPRGYCDQSVVDSGYLIGGGDLTCQYGCSGIIYSMAYRCTDFSEVEDWSFGENRFTYTFSNGPTITIGFTGNDWIAPFNSEWNISTTFSMTKRNDTGRINYTPRAITAPVLRLQAGCNHVIRIPIHDPDNDLVRCRWAVDSECAGICDAFPGAVLDSTSCSMTYSANQGVGYRAAALMIEDFAPGSQTPLSSVALQFLVFVFSAVRPCSEIPRFIPPTIAHGACVAIAPGDTFHSRLVVDSGSSRASITEIQTVSPAGTKKSELFHVQQSNSYYVNITWSPEDDQQMETHLFCYSATSSTGLSSSQVCIMLLPGYTSPAPVQGTATPNGEVVHPSNTTWHIRFDRNVMRPSTTAYIVFHEVETNMEVYRIDTSSSSEVIFDAVIAGEISIRPSYPFEEKTQFYIILERGVVQGEGGCRPGNEPIMDASFWVFNTLDITPPTIRFLASPPFSNGNISLSWESNEVVTWKCMLVNEAQVGEVNCSNATWNGVNLSSGRYELIVMATDLAGNTVEATHTFNVDLTPPVASITRKPADYSNQQTYSFRFGCNEVCTFECEFLSHGVEALVISSACNSRRYTTPPLSHGRRYTFSVTATDRVGNVGQQVNHTWETDFEEPTLFGVTNTSALCIGDTSPGNTGRAQAVDNTTAIASVTHSDRRTGCSIRRRWRATDLAGNVAYLTQYITLEFSAALNLLPTVSIACDSTTDSVQVPTSTATLQNPCRRPLQLSHEDSVNEYTCPVSFIRTWTVTDECNQKTAMFNQTISLFDLCPPSACGRNETPPHGVCILGICSCNEPWYEDNCDTLIHTPQVEPVNDVTLEELEDYRESLNLVQGTPPLTWTLVSAPNRMVLSQVSREITLRRAQAGNHTVTVEVANQVAKDSITWSLYVKAGYNAFLDPVPQSVFVSATPVQLIGHVEYIEGNIVEDFLAGVVPVSIAVSSRDAVRVIKTFTKKDGTFSETFYPAGTEYGAYVAGARHPSSSTVMQQTTWDILGMKAIPQVVQLRDSTVAEFKKTFYNATILLNDGPRALNGLTATALLGSIRGLNVMLSLKGPSVLYPGHNAYIDIQIESSGAFDASFPIRVESTEGVTIFISVSLRIAQILPRLVVDPPSVNTRVVRGTFKTLEFNVTNIGRIEAHEVRAVLPLTDLISLVSFGNPQQQTEGELTLGSGESAILSVLVNVPSEQPLGVISGDIVVSSIETVQRIRFNFLVSSNMLLNLTVVVEDEYTYFAEGQPLVGDAVVRLVNYHRGIRKTLTTAERNGTVTFIDIPEDRYELFVDAPGHIAVNRIIITSSETLEYTVFLARRAVTYTWSVVPTTFEETYIVTLEADFETHVPIPVVTITPREVSLEPYELGYEDMIQFNVTNHGLIRADDVNFELPDGHPFLEFTTEVEDLGSLDALTSIIVPVRVTRADAREKRSCSGAVAYALGVAYSYVCGTPQTRSASAVLKGFAQFSDCDTRGPPIRVRPPRTGTGTGTKRRVNDIRPGLVDQPYTTPTEISCVSCLISAAGCLPTIFPFSPCIPAIIGAIRQVIKEEPIAKDVVDILGWVGCVFPGASAVFCLPGLLRDCLNADIEGNFKFDLGIFGKRKKRSVESTVRDMVEAYYPVHLNILLGVELLGDVAWIQVEDSTWLSQVLLPTLSDGSDMETLISNTELTTILSFSPPEGATSEMVRTMVERLNNTLYGWNSGILEPVNDENMASYGTLQNLTHGIETYNERLKMKGFPSYIEAYNYAADQYNMIEDFNEDGVCAVVRIRIEQELALTREAFLAKLEIENKEVSSLNEMQLEIVITDVSTGAKSIHLFSISNESLSGSLTRGDGGWTLPSGGSGTVEWLIVPYSEAAPQENRAYTVGGTLSYILNDVDVSAPLLATRITVMPDPSLVVHYFWEKYVVGDNPFTAEREPSVPFALGVAVQNAGYGTAMNFRITSGQPEIIDNEKGLLVTFKIIGANIGSESISPSLIVEFGDIPANTTMVARWWMISSLQGQFMNYSASFEYMNPLGDPKLSVLDELKIHSLIRNVRIYQGDEDDGVLDFLADDRNDLYDFPDALYSSKTFERYNVTTGEVLSLQENEFRGVTTQEVVTTSNNSGWVYFRYEDTRGVFSSTARAINLTKIHNNQTLELPAENAWITSELQQNPGEAGSLCLHILDYIVEPGETVLTLNPCTTDCSVDEQQFEKPTPPGKCIS